MSNIKNRQAANLNRRKLTVIGAPTTSNGVITSMIVDIERGVNAGEGVVSGSEGSMLEANSLRQIIEEVVREVYATSTSCGGIKLSFDDGAGVLSISTNPLDDL